MRLQTELSVEGIWGILREVVRNVWDSLEFVFLFWRSFEGKERKKFKRFVARGSARLIKFMTLWYDGHRHAPKLGNLVSGLYHSEYISKED